MTDDIATDDTPDDEQLDALVAALGNAAGACGPGGTGCAEALRELDVFLDGELSTDHRDAVRAHLDGCTDCLGAFDFHAELKQVIAAKCREEEIPADLLQRIERCFGDDFDGDGAIG